jgi:hypothetical protein
MSGQNPRFTATAQGGHEALKQELTQQGITYEDTHGHYGMPERSLIIHGLPKSQLISLGKNYGQESVIHNEGGSREFIYTNGPNEGKAHPGLSTYETWPKEQGPPKDNWTLLPHDQSYVHLHFDFDKLHPVDASNGLQAQGRPVTKHEIGYALYGCLLDVLKKSEPSTDIENVAADYTQKAGLSYSKPVLHPHSPELGTKLASTYENAPHQPNHPQVKAAYDALKHETLAQYKHLLAHGYRFTPSAAAALTPSSFEEGRSSSTFVHHNEAPYRNDGEMLQDLAKNKHLHVFSGGEVPHDHPLAEPAPQGTGLRTYNDVFRAVHDVFGHGRTGADFGSVGEDHTWRSHMGMYSPLAQKALTTETRGQNSAFHYGKNGHINRANPQTAIYPDQKATLLPDEFHKSELTARNLNFTAESEGSTEVAEDDKTLGPHEFFHELHKGIKQRVVEFEQKCSELRKAEAALEKGVPLKKGLGDGAYADPSSEKGHMNKVEALCKLCGSKKGADHDCDSVEKYAKGEPNPKPPRDHDKDLAEYNRFKDAPYVKPWGVSKDLEPKKPVLDSTKKGEYLPAGSAPTSPGDKPGVTPDDKKCKEVKGTEGSGGDIKKAGMMGLPKPGGPGATSAQMSSPGAGGGMPKLPKLPGAGGPAKPPGGAAGPMPKVGPMSGAVPKAPKPPAMGAGTPAAKAELQKDLTWSPASKPTGPMASPFAAQPPAPPAAAMNPGVAKPQHMGGKEFGGTMAGKPLPAPAKVPQTMVERVASRMPAAAPSLAPPSPAARPQPGLPGAHLFAPKAAIGKAELKKDFSTPSGGNAPTGLGNTGGSSTMSPMGAKTPISSVGTGGGASPQAAMTSTGGAPAAPAPAPAKTLIGGAGRK